MVIAIDQHLGMIGKVKNDELLQKVVVDIEAMTSSVYDWLKKKSQSGQIKNMSRRESWQVG